MHIFKNVLLSTRRPHRRTILNLFRKLKLDLDLFQQYFTPLPSPFLKKGESKTTLGPGTSQAHPSCAQQFLSVNVSNLVAQCQISWSATARKHQWVSHAYFKSHSNTAPLNENVSKQRKKNYGKITEMSASLAFIALPMKQIYLLKCRIK